jgi:hypothetical protein
MKTWILKALLEAAATSEELESLKLQVESCRFLAAGTDFLQSFVDNGTVQPLLCRKHIQGVLVLQFLFGFVAFKAAVDVWFHL